MKLSFYIINIQKKNKMKIKPIINRDKIIFEVIN